MIGGFIGPLICGVGVRFIIEPKWSDRGLGIALLLVGIIIWKTL